MKISKKKNFGRFLVFPGCIIKSKNDMELTDEQLQEAEKLLTESRLKLILLYCKDLVLYIRIAIGILFVAVLLLLILILR